MVELEMVEVSKAGDVEQTRIVLGLLEYVGRGGEQSQRRLASELGVALGLANAYLKRCVKKGLVKVRQAPARRYAYYLTPRGFTEKSRLTLEFMSYSFALFRRAKADCMAALEAARARGYARIALIGASDPAEVAAICALDGGFAIPAVGGANISGGRGGGDSKVRRGARSRARLPWRAADRPTEECMTAAGPPWYVAQTHAEADPAPAQASPPHHVTRIVAAPPWHETGLAELARAYELLLVFTWRQISVQYKQAVLGIGWAVLSPLLSTLALTFVFGNLSATPSEGLPYPLFVLSGLITWQYFPRAITSGSNSLWGDSPIITKGYFPRLILPPSAVLAVLVDYIVNLMVLLLLMGFYGRAPGVGLLLLPVFLVFATMIGFALSLWLSALNALYRDIGFMIPIALQAWMFLTPVIYPTGLVPGGWTWLLQLNPITAVCQGARGAVLPDAPTPALPGFAIC